MHILDIHKVPCLGTIAALLRAARTGGDVLFGLKYISTTVCKAFVVGWFLLLCTTIAIDCMCYLACTAGRGWTDAQQWIAATTLVGLSELLAWSVFKYGTPN